MSDEAYAAAHYRDAVHLHRLLDAMSDAELRDLADTTALLRASAEVILEVRAQPKQERPVRPAIGDCPHCGADDAQWCRQGCPAVDRGDGR